jgi:integrase
MGEVQNEVYLRPLIRYNLRFRAAGPEAHPLRGATMGTSNRRRKGEGTIIKVHNHKSCPPAVDGVRPEHPCKGMWKATTTVWIGGIKTRKSVYAKTEKEVTRKLKALAVSEATGTLIVKSWTVSEWMTYWYANAKPDLKANTRKTYESKMKVYIIPALGSYRLDKLQPEHIRALYSKMRKQGLSESTCRQVHMILKRALKIAVRERKAAFNVADMIDPPSTKTTQLPFLSTEDAKKVLAAAGANPRYWLALFCGVRQGEALGLRWGDLYLDATDASGAPAPYLIVRRSISRETGVGLVEDTPKSATSTDRVIPLPTPVAARFVILRATQQLAGSGQDDDIVFPNRLDSGKWMASQDDNEGWNRLLREAGVVGEERAPNLHSARVTAAHLLEDAGAPQRVVQEILGHASLAMTSHYQQNNLPGKVEAMRSLEAFME